MRLLFIGLMLLAFLIGVEELAFASSSQVVTRDDVNEIAKELHPPGCTNSMTADYCPIPTAYPLKNEIFEMLKSGMQKQEILNALVDKYGRTILAAPERKGIAWVAWILPSLIVVVGSIFVIFLIKKIKRKRGNQDHSSISTINPSHIEDEHRRRIEKEMKNFL